jgi:hypothetical protein
MAITAFQANIIIIRTHMICISVIEEKTATEEWS